MPITDKNMYLNFLIARYLVMNTQKYQNYTALAIFCLKEIADFKFICFSFNNSSFFFQIDT